ncbi:MAG: zinc-dependent metalloprotease [Fulvivirga sp.]
MSLTQIKKALPARAILCAVFILMLASPLAAQLEEKTKIIVDSIPEPKPRTDKKFQSIVKRSEKLDGLFTFYRDTTSGKLYMEIQEDQFNKEFIYFSQIANGISEASAFTGDYKGSKVFMIEKFYDKVDFVAQNNAFYFNDDNPLSRSAEANISEGVMATEEIEAKGDGCYLIEADNLFMKETFDQVKPEKTISSLFGYSLGGLDSKKTKVRDIRNYPENTDILVEYVYSKSSGGNGASDGITDGRNVSIKVYHSLIEMPDNAYKPRYGDPRVGYFISEVTDMTSASATPYRDKIHRWNLVKKHPEQAVSEPVEPIVWWIENTTPLAFRETIKEGVLQWNKAFEKAGFKNALVVKIQPDDATWDAGDIRYNVLRWTSSPKPRFGGYGPSFVNPKTGQIMGADIMLEYAHHTNKVTYSNVFDLEPSGQNAEVSALDNPAKFCMNGNLMQQNNLFGQTVLMAEDAGDLTLEGMKKQSMLQLIMHEVGHTLGLNHNMKASQLYTPAQLQDEEFMEGKALAGSVMDYLAINLTKDKSQQGMFFSPTIGPYDEWAIEFGYKPVDSKKDLEEILIRSTEPGLAFGNDADDMRSSTSGIDPRVMTGDQSNDQITYSRNRIELVAEMMGKIKGNYSKEGQSYQALRQAYYILLQQYAKAGTIVSRFIGGIYVDRAMIGQEGATQPFTPVAYEDQKRAMELLSDYIFAPDAFGAPAELYSHLAMQRRGFNFYKKTEDPKIHNSILASQKMILRHLLHQNTLQRLVDSELYGNSYELAEFMKALNEAIFKADIKKDVNSFRQNLQVEYTTMLISIINSSSYNNMARSLALYNLNEIKEKVSKSRGDIATKAHKAHLETLINNALEGYGS